MNTKHYTGIDFFRIIACIFVIAIHTAPLYQINEDIDLLFTRGLCRLAVPFFFMTSGFFLIRKYTENSYHLIQFEKKLCLLYFISILIYLPVNLYSGYFNMFSLPSFLQDIFFDGTFYHLWYFPSCILGSLIAYYLVKKYDYRISFIITFILYLIGLGGDTYYGIFTSFPAIKNIYAFLFTGFDYTRNVLFFAPIFFVLGGYIHDHTEKIQTRNSFVLFIVFTIGMLLECYLSHQENIIRFDSMYLLLIPAVYYLFIYLLSLHLHIPKNIRTVTSLVYIIHPMCIIIIRGICKFAHTEIIKDCHLLFFFLVTILSFSISIFISCFKKERKTSKLERSSIVIDTKALEHNVFELKKYMQKESEVMAVVKADAYGHNAFIIATHLEKIGIKAFAVATIDEAISLRKYGIRSLILILGYTDPNRIYDLKKYHLTQTLISYEYALELEQRKIKIDAHIAIDTGMHRIGIPCDENAFIQKILNFKYIHTTGIFTHLCVSDSLKEQDITFTKLQIHSFYKAIDNIDTTHLKIHIQSSSGLLNYSYLKCDYVRIGISLYGVSSANENTILHPDLKPVLSLKTKVVLLRKVKKNETIGYGRTYTCNRDSLIAVLPIGYADGLPRLLSNHNSIIEIHHQTVPVAGRICMDQMMIDVTDIPNVQINDIVTIFGNLINVSTIAQETNTISNEILSCLGKRLIAKER